MSVKSRLVHSASYLPLNKTANKYGRRHEAGGTNDWNESILEGACYILTARFELIT